MGSLKIINSKLKIFLKQVQITQLTFTFSKSTIKTLEKDEIRSKLTIKTPERRH